MSMGTRRGSQGPLIRRQIYSILLEALIIFIKRRLNTK